MSKTETADGRNRCVCTGERVEKTFARPADAGREAAVYRLLEGSELPHARVVNEAGNALVLSRLPGITYLELLERQELEQTAELAPWTALAAWTAEFYRVTGLVPGDVNLRNFLYDPDTKTAAGVDFEACRPGDPSEMWARLCAYVLLYDPAQTPWKRRVAEHLRAQAASSWPVSPAQVAEAVEALKAARNKKRMCATSGIVLAGGKSRRMGRDKSALQFCGAALPAWQADKLRRLGVEDVLVSGRGPGMIADDIPDCGPLGGLYSCLRRAGGIRCLVLPLDVPLVPESCLRMLLDAHQSGITLLERDGKPEPLIGVYDSALWTQIGEILQGGSAAVMRLADRVGYQTVPYQGDDSLLINCNTPEAMREAIQIADRMGMTNIPG